MFESKFQIFYKNKFSHKKLISDFRIHELFCSLPFIIFLTSNDKKRCADTKINKHKEGEGKTFLWSGNF